MKVIKIYNAIDIFEANKIIDALMDNNINCYMSDAHTGGYLMIQQNFSIYGKDIYVLEKDKEKAEEIIRNVLQINIRKSEEKNIKIPWYKNRTILARILIIFLLLGYVLSMFIK